MVSHYHRYKGQLLITELNYKLVNFIDVLWLGVLWVLSGLDKGLLEATQSSLSKDMHDWIIIAIMEIIGRPQG